MLKFSKSNVSIKKIIQSKIYEYELDLNNLSWAYTDVLIEDDDATLYTQKEWKKREIKVRYKINNMDII